LRFNRPGVNGILADIRYCPKRGAAGKEEVRTMRRAAWILAAFLLLAGCGQAEKPEDVPGIETAREENVSGAGTAEEEDDFPIQPAVLEGEGLSPDGRFQAQTVGHSEGVTSAGFYPAESVQITDAETGEVLWEGDGAYEQSILWSPEGGFAALARGVRTWCSVTIIETENWTSWDFTLPDGSPIPEYTFFPDDVPWGVWVSESRLDLTIGRGGDAGEQKYYACAVNVRENKLEGITWEEGRESLPGSYDLDHDGEPETVEVVKILAGGDALPTGGYELQIRKADGAPLWIMPADESHVGWASCFACRKGKEDYLLRYEPTMFQGFATYSYQLFSLSGSGEERVVQEGSVEFDTNFGSRFYEDNFDPEAIAAFLEEVHGLLADSTLLLTTESGEFRSGGSGADFQDDLNLWTDDPLYDESKSLVENIRAIGDYWREQRTE